MNQLSGDDRVSQKEPGLGEQALSKVAEVGLASQLDEAEEINVDIRTDPIKLVQGEVDSVAIEGKGLVVQQDLRMEAVEVNTGNVAINPLSTVLGKIELTQPTDADARIVLTEADINRALGSDYLRAKMQNLELEVDGQPVVINTQDAELKLPGDGKIALSTALKMQDTGETKQLSVTAVPCLRDNGQRISLEEILFAEGQGLSLEFATALFNRIMELLDLRKFDLKGISLQFKKLDVQEGQLIFQANATVSQFPSA